MRPGMPDPARDLTGATPETLTRALFRRVEPLRPRPGGESVRGDEGRKPGDDGDGVDTADTLTRPTRKAEEEDRTPAGRPDFKSGEMRTTCLVGSTPTLFRQMPKERPPRTGEAGGSRLARRRSGARGQQTLPRTGEADGAAERMPAG